MKKISIVILGLILFAGACNKSAPVQNNQSEQPAAESPAGQTVLEGTDRPVGPADEPAAKTYEIQMTSSGFVPSTLTIKQGDTVKFINTDTSAHWPASAPHPTHTDYPAFDPKKAIAAGDSWSFTFDLVGAWKFHDHLNPSSFGTITVTQ